MELQQVEIIKSVHGQTVRFHYLTRQTEIILELERTAAETTRRSSKPMIFINIFS